MDDEMDILTYYRKMKQLELTMQTIFTQKERYLLRKQNCFVLDTSLNAQAQSEDEDAEDSDREDGPKQSQKWW